MAIRELYPRNQWKMVADPKGSAEHTLGTIGLWCSLGKPAYHNIQWRDKNDGPYGFLRLLLE
jgi:hypothetical protein